MTILLAGTILIGAALARFFKVLILAPACTVLLVVVAFRPAHFGSGWAGSALDFMALISSLETGYALALFTPAFPNSWKRFAGCRMAEPVLEPPHRQTYLSRLPAPAEATMRWDHEYDDI